MDGVWLVLLLISTQLVAYIMSEHLVLYQRMTGVKSTNAMIALIYEKQFKISTASNKRFSQGEMVNFVQVDAMKMYWLSTIAPQIFKLPPLLLVCFIFLFYWLGYAFFAGVAVFVFTFFFNMKISKTSAKWQKTYMQFQDKRLNATTEALNNIKILKMYSWNHIFE